MTKDTKVNAAILIIGNEILSGRTQDTNTSTLATWLNSIGVKVNEVRVIPDIEKIIREFQEKIKKQILMVKQPLLKHLQQLCLEQ